MGVKKLEYPYQRVKSVAIIMSIQLDTVPALDRETDRQTDRQNWFINIALLCTDMLTRDKNTYAFLCWTTPYAFTILEVYRKPKRYVAHH